MNGCLPGDRPTELERLLPQVWEPAGEALSKLEAPPGAVDRGGTTFTPIQARARVT
jgi:hypothetical protein